MTHYIFDCDDVLLNWQNAFAMYLGHRGIHVKEAPTEWCLSGWIGCAPATAKLWVEKFNASDSFAHMVAMRNAYDVVWALKDAGHTLDIVTACGDTATTRQRRQINIDQVFKRDGNSPFDLLTFVPLGASKSQALLNYTLAYDIDDLVFCEDNFDHALVGSRLGIKSYCLRRSHNRHQEASESSVVWIDDIMDTLPQEVVA